MHKSNKIHHKKTPAVKQFLTKDTTEPQREDLSCIFIRVHAGLWSGEKDGEWQQMDAV